MSFSEQFIQIMDYIGQQIGIMIDWTSQNVGPYIMDLFNRLSIYIVTREVISLIGLIIMLIVGLKLLKKSHVNAKIHEYDPDFAFGWIIAIIILSISSVFISFSIFSTLCGLAEAILIPEKQIIEYLLQVKNIIQ